MPFPILKLLLRQTCTDQQYDVMAATQSNTCSSKLHGLMVPVVSNLRGRRARGLHSLFQKRAFHSSLHVTVAAPESLGGQEHNLDSRRKSKLMFITVECSCRPSDDTTTAFHVPHITMQSTPRRAQSAHDAPAVPAQPALPAVPTGRRHTRHCFHTRAYIRCTRTRQQV